MDHIQFRQFGKATIDYIVEYVDNIRNRPVVPLVEPRYLQKVLPAEAPVDSESWEDILKDVEKHITPGLTHWQSPNFHGYYPIANSFPGVVGVLLEAGYGTVGWSWECCPALTELDIIMTDWLGRFIGLPNDFYNQEEGRGGGIIQPSGCESTFLAFLSAKNRLLRQLKEITENFNEAEVRGKLVGYASDEVSSAVLRSGLLASVNFKLLPSNKFGQLESATLQEAIDKDRQAGLIPVLVVATLGTARTCAFDDLEDIGPVCQRENIWLHVDAAYSGTAFALPEYRYLMKGIEYADTFEFNPHMWMLVSFDCWVIWAKDVRHFADALSVDRVYLNEEDCYSGVSSEYRRHWCIALGRKFRVLKLWFVLRTYGREGIEKHIRGRIALASLFEKHLKTDDRFEIIASSLGLVCFRLRSSSSSTQDLLKKVKEKKILFLKPSIYKEQFLIQFVICSPLTNEKDIDFAWEELQSYVDALEKQ